VYRNDIMEQLVTTEAYEDPNIYMMARLPYEETEVDIKNIYKNLNNLIESKQNFAKRQVEQMFSSLDFLNVLCRRSGLPSSSGGYLLPSSQHVPLPSRSRC
jgi:hypothetical protein